MEEIGQSRTGSLVEAIIGTLIGFVVTMATQIAIFPWFGIIIPLTSNLSIGLIFLAISVIRSYIMRRFFDRLKL